MRAFKGSQLKQWGGERPDHVSHCPRVDTGVSSTHLRHPGAECLVTLLQETGTVPLSWEL